MITKIRRAMLFHNLKRLGPWFHDVEVMPGVRTFDFGMDERMKVMPVTEKYPLDMWKQIRKFIPENMEGKYVLDLGCCVGFMSLEFAKMGAQVIAVDRTKRFLKSLRYLSRVMKLESRIETLQFELTQKDWIKKVAQHKYEIILCAGVFYHLNNPEDLIADINKLSCRRFIGETMICLDDSIERQKAFASGKMGIVMSKEYLKNAFLRSSSKIRDFQYHPRVSPEDEVKMSEFYKNNSNRVLFVVDYVET